MKLHEGDAYFRACRVGGDVSLFRVPSGTTTGSAVAKLTSNDPTGGFALDAKHVYFVSGVTLSRLAL